MWDGTNTGTLDLVLGTGSLLGWGRLARLAQRVLGDPARHPARVGIRVGRHRRHERPQRHRARRKVQHDRQLARQRVRPAPRHKAREHRHGGQRDGRCKRHAHRHLLERLRRRPASWRPAAAAAAAAPPRHNRCWHRHSRAVAGAPRVCVLSHAQVLFVHSHRVRPSVRHSPKRQGKEKGKKRRCWKCRDFLHFPAPGHQQISHHTPLWERVRNTEVWFPMKLQQLWCEKERHTAFSFLFLLLTT